MNELPYLSGLTVKQWALIEPLLPAAKTRISPKAKNAKVNPT